MGALSFIAGLVIGIVIVILLVAYFPTTMGAAASAFARWLPWGHR